MTPGRPDPLILTAMLDDLSQARFERERQLHFPQHLNVVPAHVMLFHQLPGDQQDEIEAALLAACRNHPEEPFEATGLRFLGRGNAYVLHMPGVAALRRELGQLWHGWLTAQDRQAWQPHVTIQNKVEPAAARRLQQQLAANFVPQSGLVRGLELWRYLGGPWQSVQQFPLREIDRTIPNITKTIV